ncbi:ethylbenzene dehydrogenase-related protein [Motilimonas sp. E26]|uniref:ethylbenzene dehydrogenase-related protein n=1 Tax=Motilimonas sp. E26 TaxID=2865674 RepID=UPI001E5C015A|nr:ethylbenzene dehydrogenase-related protein [Motilimonas sp. E26]MCE0556825.1 hypothetical protein [Motilimonas sp. E26]
MLVYKRKTSWPLVVVHLIGLLALLLSFFSGLRLAQDSLFALPMPQWLMPQGDVYFWHGIGALLWIFVLIGYAGFALFRNKPLSAVKSRHLIIQLIRVLTPLAVISGTLLYLSPAWLSYLLLLEGHYYIALLMMLVVTLHVVVQIQAGLKRTWPIFLPQRATLLECLPMLGGVVVIVTCFLFYPAITPKLVSLRTTDNIVIDGLNNEWDRAEKTTLLVTQGANQATSVTVTAQSMHDGEVVYFLFQWPDAKADLMHLPLVKTAQGWQVEHQGFEVDDEITFYEDKFALMLSESARIGGAGSIHLGPAPINGAPPSRSGRGYHYMKQGMVDVWQWKSVRLNHMSVLDDDHFGQPAPPCDFCPRYTAGYQTDPKEAGGYRMNWQWFKQEQVLPLRLPKQAAWQRLEQRDQFAISWWDTQPYSEHLDTYPIGTRLPSVLWMDSFEGDRADVQAKAHWQDGVWSLEIARNRDTGSKFDLPLVNGLYLWPATFDASQTRHSYSQQPWQLVMEQKG